MFKTIKIIMVIFLVIPIFCQALAVGENIFTPSSQAFIKCTKIDWQTYEFEGTTNIKSDEGIKYRWQIDDQYINTGKTLVYTFDPGQYTIFLIASDNWGNNEYDQMIINVNFWSFDNYYLWLIIYGFVALIIVYYWVIKLIYLFNRRRVKKKAREFLDILDAHGWVEKVVDEIVKHNKS